MVFPLGDSESCPTTNKGLTIPAAKKGQRPDTYQPMLERSAGIGIAPQNSRAESLTYRADECLCIQLKSSAF